MQQPIHSSFSGMPWEGHNAEFAAVWIGGSYSPRSGRVGRERLQEDKAMVAGDKYLARGGWSPSKHHR